MLKQGGVGVAVEIEVHGADAEVGVHLAHPAGGNGSVGVGAGAEIAEGFFHDGGPNRAVGCRGGANMYPLNGPLGRALETRTYSGVLPVMNWTV